MEQDNSIGPSVLSAPGDVVIVTAGASTCSIKLNSISSPSGFSYVIQGTIDGSTWFSVAAYDPTTLGTYVRGAQTVLTGQWLVPCAGLAKVRFHLTAIGGGSAVVTMIASDGTAPVIVTGGSIALIPSFVKLAPSDVGGLSTTSFLITNDTAAHVIKASAGQLYGITASNNSSVGYLKMYNAVTATAGAGTPFDRFEIPGGVTNIRWENGVAYGTGLTASHSNYWYC
jgi:hypothetical protein